MKKFLAGIMSIMMTLSITACGKSEQPKKGESADLGCEVSDYLFLESEDKINKFIEDNELRYDEDNGDYFNHYISITLDEENHKADVFLAPEEVSLAIGRNGLNIKLASLLTEYTIDVYRDSNDGEDEDIYLEEFDDEIDGWVIDAIKAIGLDTAKSVLNAPRDMLIEKADLEEETVDHVLSVLRSEFEK